MSALPEHLVKGFTSAIHRPDRRFGEPADNGGRKSPSRQPFPEGSEPPEAGLLLALLRFLYADTPVDAAAFDSIDWTRLMLFAGRHHVRPLIASALSQQRHDSVSEKALDDLRFFAQANTRRNLFLTTALLELLELLESHGIEAATFKGPILASGAWKSPALRESGDLDLLVRHRDVVRAWHLLEQRGFIPIFPTAGPREIEFLQRLHGPARDEYLLRHGEHHLLLPRGRVNVDLHSSIALREFWILRRPDEVWNWLSWQNFAGRKVRGFGPEHNLLVLCINGAKDCWQRIDRVCDIAELLMTHPTIHWETVESIARSIGSLRMLRMGLYLSQELLGVSLPGAARESVARDPKLPALAAEVREQMFAPTSVEAEAPGLAKSLFQLRLREQWHDRLGYCLAHFEPTVGDWAAMPLPAGLSFLHYLFRPLRLVGKFAALL